MSATQARSSAYAHTDEIHTTIHFEESRRTTQECSIGLYRIVSEEDEVDLWTRNIGVQRTEGFMNDNGYEG